MKKLRVALPLAAALSLAPSFAVTPYMVADIDPRFMSDDSQPARFASVAGRVVFIAGGGVSLWGTQGSAGDPALLLPETLHVRTGPVAAGGRAFVTACDNSSCGLFATIGTPAGTIRLAGFPNLFFSTMEAVAPAGLPRTLVTLNAGTGNGTVIWRTDGTPAGTRKVGMTARNPRELVAFRGKGWFFADLGNVEGALFSTDGLNGTRRIGTSIGGSRLTAVGNRLVYYAGQEIWGSDGTPEGTRRFAALSGFGSSFRPPIVVAGSRAFFFNVDGSRRELWATDGTLAGTSTIVSVDGESPTDLRALGAKVAFVGRDDARGLELWASDGTTAGTRRIKDICPGTCGGVFQLGVSALGRIWFAGFSPDRGIEVWTSNLTTAGTHQVRDLCPGSCSSVPAHWFASGGRVYFVGQGGSDARLFASDGTAAGTLAVGVTTSSSFSDTLDAAPLAGASIVYAGFDAEHGVEPWISNGSPAGTRRLADLQFDNRTGSNPRSFAAAGGRAFFFAEDGVHGSELWVSDGTEEGTQLADDLVPGPGSTNQDLAASEAGGRLVLFLRMGFNQYDLVGSDGTPAGSAHLLPDGVRADGRQARVGDHVFFVGIDDSHGAELWATDGTPGGTTRLSDLVPPDPFRPDVGLPIFLALGNQAVAPVLSPAGGEELLISDGTVAGTRSIDESYPFLEGPLQIAQSPLVVFGGRFWFVAAETGGDTATLWRTDLTVSGTVPIGPLDLSRAGSGRWSLVPLGGKLLVFGLATGLGDALWTSDGTAAGTRVVGPVSFGQGVSPVAFAGRLWFANSFGELWSTDGTAAGTLRALDAADRTIETRTLAVLDNRLVIATSGGFYESDGTPAGTVRIEVPGRPFPFSSFSALSVGDRIFFTWDDLVHGPELWALRPD
jgi:ELWxxDGT repeat protein